MASKLRKLTSYLPGTNGSAGENGLSGGLGDLTSALHDLYNLSGAASAVACVTHPSLGQCANAALNAALTLGAGGEGDAVLALERAGEDAADAGADAAAAGCLSFTPSTKVLMAHGKSKAIVKVRPGDEVEAADPSTGGHKGARTVTAQLTDHDSDLVDVTVRTGPHSTAVVHTTSRHPFWDDTLRAWVVAGRLKPGDALETATGHHTPVVSVRPHPGTATMYDLTVQGPHTYYVLAGDTPVLVHNATPGQKCDLTLGAGPNAREGVGLENGDIEADGVRDLINESGNAHGCHTCDATTPGTKDGDWIPDHQPPSSLVAPGSPQTAYPHCLPCARRQGGVVSQLLQGKSKKEW